MDRSRRALALQVAVLVTHHHRPLVGLLDHQVTRYTLSSSSASKLIVAINDS